MTKINIGEIIEKHYKIILLVLLVLICISRFYQFGTLPKAIGVDEAGAAYDAYNIANYGVDRYLNSFPIYLKNFGGGQSVLYAYLNAFLIKVLNINNIFVSRLPELILFTIAIILSYKLVEQKENKKTALLFAFFIIITPWHIVNSRIGLDCNLLSPMFIITLYFLETAKKNYQYILAGICFGLTLYSYGISYIIMPAFLLVWLIYNLYFKKITIKQVAILMATISVFAIPLIYFLLLNYGIFSKTDFGIFTITKFAGFRGGDVKISNLWSYGLRSLKTIFLSENTLYYIQIPLFIIGLFFGIKETIVSLKKKEYSFLSLMTLIFFAILITNLFVAIYSTNKANILYIPIFYFITVGVLKLIKNNEILLIITIFIFLLLFTIFEINYYKYYSLYEHNQYEDIKITQTIEDLKSNNIKLDNIYLFEAYRVEPYIYVALKEELSPYDFMKNFELRRTEGMFSIKYICGNIHCWDTDDMEIYHNDRTYIVNKRFNDAKDILDKLQYDKFETEEYYIYYTK